MAPGALGNSSGSCWWAGRGRLARVCFGGLGECAREAVWEGELPRRAYLCARALGRGWPAPIQVCVPTFLLGYSQGLLSGPTHLASQPMLSSPVAAAATSRPVNGAASPVPSARRPSISLREVLGVSYRPHCSCPLPSPGLFPPPRSCLRQLPASSHPASPSSTRPSVCPLPPRG